MASPPQVSHPPANAPHHRHSGPDAPPLHAAPAPAAGGGRLVRFGADFAASWACGGCALIVTHPIDTVRVRYQVLGEAPMAVVRSAMATGPLTLFAGISAPLLTGGPHFAVVFAMYQCFREAARELNPARPAEQRPHHHAGGDFRTAELFAGGALAGAIAAVPQAPVTAVRVRQQVASKHRAAGEPPLGAREALAMARRSPVGVYGPFSAELMSGAIGFAVFFSAYDTIKLAIVARRAAAADARGDAAEAAAARHAGTAGLLFHERMAAGAATSALSWGASFPFDLARTRLHADGFGGRPLEFRNSMGRCLAAAYRTGGLRGLWAGYPLVMARSALSNALKLPILDALQPRVRAMAAGAAAA